jgi:hypothetical protein
MSVINDPHNRACWSAIMVEFQEVRWSSGSGPGNDRPAVGSAEHGDRLD